MDVNGLFGHAHTHIGLVGRSHVCVVIASLPDHMCVLIACLPDHMFALVSVRE